MERCPKYYLFPTFFLSHIYMRIPKYMLKHDFHQTGPLKQAPVVIHDLWAVIYLVSMLLLRWHSNCNYHRGDHSQTFAEVKRIACLLMCLFSNCCASKDLFSDPEPEKYMDKHFIQTPGVQHTHTGKKRDAFHRGTGSKIHPLRGEIAQVLLF